jgi:hypothetical protein
MSEKNYDNQAPIFRFLIKHKWRIILPMLFAAIFWAYPRYSKEYVAVQQNIFIKSSGLYQIELKQEIMKTKNRVHSEEFLSALISKYDLYKTEKSQNTDEKILIERLRDSVEIRLQEEEMIEGVGVFIWIIFKKENSTNIAELSNYVTAQFESNPNFQANKYVSKPYDANPWRNYVFFGGLLQGLVMLIIPLILLWEIPNMFYSPKTQNTVFKPIKSDWQAELTQAKL